MRGKSNQYKTRQDNATQYMIGNTRQDNPTPFGISEDKTIQRNARQYNTIQFKTRQDKNI